MRLLCSLVLLLTAGLASAADDFTLDYARLTPTLKLLTNEDRSLVDQAINLIRSGDNAAALATLSGLTATNPENSAVRILAAFASLKIGNFTGALDHARKAESAPNGDSYKCLVLAAVAWKKGDKTLCRRELEHVKGAGERDPMVADLERKLKNKKS